MAVHRRRDGAAVRRAVGEVAVVVVDGAEDAEEAAGAAAAGGPGAGRPGAARGVAGEGGGGRRARQEPEPVEGGPRRAAARVGQVAGREVPDRLRRRVRLAVPFALVGGVAASDGVLAAGADVVRVVDRGRRAVGAGEVVDGRRRVAAVLGPVDVAHAGAGRAGVAVAAAVGGEEAVADARGVQGEGGGDVAVGLAGAVVGRRTVAVVAVDAVAVLVERHARQLAGVGAAAAGTEEVDRRAVPVGVAGLVEVDVGGELGVEPAVGGQPAARRLLGAVEHVELRARRVGVAGAARARGRAVGARRAAHGDQAVGVGGLGDRAAAVGDGDVLAVEGRRARGAAEDAGRVGIDAGGDVGPRQRHHHLGGGAVAAVGAAGGRAVLVGIEEVEDLAGLGVDATAPGAGLAGALEGELPDQREAAAGAHLVTLGGALVGDVDRDEAQRAGVDPLVVGVEAAQEVAERALRGDAVELGARDGGAGGRQVLAAELDQVAVVDAEDDAGALDRHAAADDVEVDEPDVAGGLTRTAGVEHQLGGVDAQRARHAREERAGGALEGGDVDLAVGRQRLRVARPQVVAAARDPGDAGAFGVGDAARALVDVGGPLAVDAEGESVPTQAQRLVHDRTGGRDGLGVGDDGSLGRNERAVGQAVAGLLRRDDGVRRRGDQRARDEGTEGELRQSTVHGQGSSSKWMGRKALQSGYAGRAEGKGRARSGPAAGERVRKLVG